MELSVQLYLALLALVAVGRVLELRRSRKNQMRLLAAGGAKSPEPGYLWMVALHVSILVGAALETVWLHRPWIPSLGIVAVTLFLSANAARWWVIRTLGPRWNVQVVSPSLGVIANGPYRYVRHPNYTAVFVEMLALPLIHSAWIVAAIGTFAHIFVLRHRVALEESVLQRNPAWQAAFAQRPRFLP
ncbi:MAG: isoprenylcysteine carboxylmethyltransferase family protein [Bryobacteraceae bacterium]